MALMNEEEIRLRLGFDATAVTRGTQVMLDAQKKAAQDYVGFWQTALQKTAQAESAANDASLARLKNNLAQKARLQQEFFENQAAQADIAQGSIPANMRGGVRSGRGGNGAVGMAAATAFQDAATGHNAGIIKDITLVSAGMHIQNSINQLAEGKNPYAGLSRLPHAIGKLIEFIGINIRTLTVLGGTALAGYKIVKLGQVAGGAGLAKGQEVFSGVDLAQTTVRISGDLAGVIDDFEARGLISKGAAARLRAMSDGTHGNDSVRTAQKYLLQAQRQDAEKIAAANERTESAARGAANAAWNKAAAEKESLAKQKEQDEINDKFSKLLKERDRIDSEYRKIEQETPTIGDLAGRGFTASLNKRYGAGGIFDLGKGDGPFAAIAQDYQLAQKQQMWDIIHGNAVFDKTGALIGGTAYADKQRQIADMNQLGAAGLQTPEMKMSQLRDAAVQISKDMGALYDLAVKDGLNMKLVGTDE